MVDYGTFGIWRAVAWVTTILFTTSQIARTVIVHKTFGLAASTIRIAFMAFRAETLRAMNVHTTKSIRTTRFENAWILTLTVNASLGRRTVGIGSTTNLETLDLRISSESFSTHTDRAMLDNSAFGVWSTNTRSLEARINTTLFDTSLSSLAIGIDFAFRLDDR